MKIGHELLPGDPGKTSLHWKESAVPSSLPTVFYCIKKCFVLFDELSSQFSLFFFYK